MLINTPQEMPATPVVFDVTTEDFEDKVMRASLKRPVIVDFWAPWCGPCKQLMPVLEKVVRASQGEVLLAKVNIDDNPELAQALQIQSVPTVFAFFQGQPVDAFMGVQPETQLRAFIGKLIAMANGAQPDALNIPESLKQAAEYLNAGDIGSAHNLYAQILQQDPVNAQSYVGMVRCFITAGQLEQAKGLVDNAPEEIAKTAAFAQARVALELANTQPAGELDALQKKVEASPEDQQAKLDLAAAQYACGQKEQAVDTLLQSIGQDRDWNEQAARKELLKLFDAIGSADPITIKARRRLSSLLFS